VARAAILDIDGTLVDTNYHHTIAWDRAIAKYDAEVPLWQIHRHIGMGGDQIVTELAGEDVEDRAGDEIREAEGEHYSELIGEVRVIEGARELIEELRRRELSVVLASSAKEDEVDHYLDLLEARDAVEWTTSADVENTKPDPDLVRAALEKAGTEEAIMVGDSVWDVKAAKRAGVDTIGVLTGGFGEAELRSAGAIEVYESVVELRLDLDNTPLGT
jgi:HAD superfamily hydrolase (TIGR01549 family)